MKYPLLVITMIISVSLFAQRGGEREKRGEKIEQQRIAYITTELDLSIEEAQSFWPIYNEYQKAKKEIGPEREAMAKMDDLTEDEASVMLENSLTAKRRRVDLEVDFMIKLEKVLPAKKRLKLLRADRKFKKVVLKRFKKRMKRSEKMKNKGESRN